MRKTLATLGAMLVLAACTKGKEYESSGALDSTADTTHKITVPGIEVSTKKDTVTVPVIETKKDTIIVDKPVGVGRKKVEVTRPTVTRKP